MDKCLDTYALIEIHQGNPAFVDLIRQGAFIPDLILAEFYGVMYSRFNLQTAEYWKRKLDFLCVPVSRKILIKSVKYRIDNKKQRLSFFDCVGYIFSLENNMKFVTGDREFKDKEGVEFIK